MSHLPRRSAPTPAHQPSSCALHTWALVLLLALGAAVVPVAAQAAESTTVNTTTIATTAMPADSACAAALAQFNRAVGGDDAAIDSALSQWRKLLAADPGNLALATYTGAATAMQARTTVFPWKKMAHADDGLAMIDKALAQLAPAHDTQWLGGVPVSLLVRFTAAGTFNAMPAMFNRADRGARLMDELLKNPLLAAAPLGFQGAVWLRAADDAARAQRSDEARRWLQKLAASGAPQAGAAQARLKAL